MLEKETHYLFCCVRSSRVSVRARGISSRPCVSSPVNTPVFQHLARVRVAMDCARIGVTSGNLPVVYISLCARPFERLLDDLITVVWVNRRVTVAVKNNGRDSWQVG